MHAKLLRDGARGGDFYPTPAWATHALFDRIGPLKGRLWEPACGDGSMARVILERCDVYLYPTDLHDRGYGGVGVDFLTAEPWKCDHVVTNPPYSLAEPFVRHALGLASGTVAMLLKLNFLEGVKRKKLFQERPPAWVYVFSRRIKFPMPSGQGGGVLAYAWFVWTPGATETKVGWI
jgi:hypothetical protein